MTAERSIVCAVDLAKGLVYTGRCESQHPRSQDQSFAAVGAGGTGRGDHSRARREAGGEAGSYRAEARQTAAGISRGGFPDSRRFQRSTAAGNRGDVLAVAILLDTHAFLWAITDDPKLSRQARKILQTAKLFLSVASLWEIVTKVQTGKLRLPETPSKYLPRHLAALGVELLAIEASHILRLESLPLHHRDPFDRLLLAQSLEERLPLLSCDTLLEPYGADIRW